MICTVDYYVLYVIMYYLYTSNMYHPVQYYIAGRSFCILLQKINIPRMYLKLE